MKKVGLFFLSLIALVGCSSNDVNENRTEEVGEGVPLTPSDLYGLNPQSTRVVLYWLDNSDNESGFRIERKTATGNYEIIAEPTENLTTYEDNEVLNHVEYTYRISSFNSFGNSIDYSNEFTIMPLGMPALNTLPVTSITYKSAISGGEIINEGDTAITSKGVVWSTLPNPTIEESDMTMDGYGDDSFSSSLSSLLAGTTYYVRAYAVNSDGVAYGNQFIFETTTLFINGYGVVDIEENYYPSIIINGQEWMSKNLNVSTYRNGDPILQVSEPSGWAGLTQGAWCYYEYNTEDGPQYGKLYNWFAVNDERGLAPQGWHIPSDSEWTVLTNYLGGQDVAGGKMKDFSLWNDPNTEASNESGFKAISGGYCNSGYFYGLGNYGYWWTSTYSSSDTAWLRSLSWDSGNVSRYNDSMMFGCSVRCVKN